MSLQRWHFQRVPERRLVVMPGETGQPVRLDIPVAKARLEALGESVSDRLTVEQRGWLADFVRAGEVEVGLEMLAEWPAEDEHPLSADERAEAVSLADDLGLRALVEDTLRLCPDA